MLIIIDIYRVEAWGRLRGLVLKLGFRKWVILGMHALSTNTMQLSRYSAISKKILTISKIFSNHPGCPSSAKISDDVSSSISFINPSTFPSNNYISLLVHARRLLFHFSIDCFSKME
jgi:hypothetical protein